MLMSRWMCGVEKEIEISGYLNKSQYLTAQVQEKQNVVKMVLSM